MSYMSKVYAWLALREEQILHDCATSTGFLDAPHQAMSTSGKYRRASVSSDGSFAKPPTSEKMKVLLTRSATYPQLPVSPFSTGLASLSGSRFIIDSLLSALKPDRGAADPFEKSVPRMSILKRRGQSRKGERSVHFVDSVLLWEAAYSDDTEEMAAILGRIGRLRSGTPTSEANVCSISQYDATSESIDYVAKVDVDINMCNHEGVTLLHVCCFNGNTTLVRLLLDAGATPDFIDCDGWTPLHVAASVGRMDIVGQLIDAGATVPEWDSSDEMEGLRSTVTDESLRAPIYTLAARRAEPVSS